MATTETQKVEQRGRESGGIRPPSSSALRLSATIRVAIAVLLAAALTAAAIAAQWGPLTAKSTVIGYPIFEDFNPNNYGNAFYLTAGFFPIAALLIFLGVTRIGPRVGLAAPPPRGRLRPLAAPAEADPLLGPEPSWQINRGVAAGARVAIVGAVLGLEVGVASNHLWQSVVLVTVGYSLLVVLGSMALSRFVSASAFEVRLATVNCLGSSLTIAGLVLVSAHTEVRVLSNNSVHHYPWFPVWLGVPLAAALFTWLSLLLRRAGSARTVTIERRAVLLIAASVALFVFVAWLPGDLGWIGLYEEGQFLTETMLVLHGWLPWRDVLIVHGLLRDVVPTAVGWGVFGNSYWGSEAGASIIFLPLTVVTTFWLLAYLVGRSWPVLLIGASVFLGTWVGQVDARFLLWPLVLLLLAAVLKRFTRARAGGLGVLLVVQGLLTPEMVGAVPIVVVVVAAYEWYWQRPGAPLAEAFRRTIWVVIGAVAFALLFAIYMASRGGLGDYVTVTLLLLVGHFGQGIPPNVGGVEQARYDFVALAPLAAVLISFAYAVARLRLRRPFWLADWPMAASALFVLGYYPKFLTFMDFPHAYEPFMMATPLMIYIVYRAVAAADDWIRAHVLERRVGWLTGHPVGIAVLILFVVGFWGPLHTVVERAPAVYRPTAPDPPITRVGYAVQYDSASVADLRKIVDAYVGPHDRLLDLTDEPALFYYWLDRDPSSLWFAPNALLDTPTLQRSLLTDLRRDPPKLIIFDDTNDVMYGLPAISGVPDAVFLYFDSRWILEHYSPLVESHGRVIYALRGLPSLSSLHLHLDQKPMTTGVPFLGQDCNWNDAPTFLTGPVEPPSGAQSVSARTSVVRPAEVTFAGWAGDLRAREPAREVIATYNGRIIARARPGIDRPDVPKAGFPAGFLRGGFQLSIPTWANASSALRVFAIGRDGSVAELGILSRPPRGGTARIGNRTVTLEPSADTGHVDTESATGPLVQIEPPVGTTWADYRWLVVESPSFGGFLPGDFILTNQRGAVDPGNMISFATLPNSPRHYVIPVSSCAQWYGYGSSPLYLVNSPPQEIGGVGLIR